MANKLEQELKSLEKSIRKLEGLIPTKEGVTPTLYGKKYRMANEKYLSEKSLTSGLFKDKWIRLSRGFVGGEVRGLGESLEHLIQKRKEIRKLLGTEKITSKTIIPEEVRHLFPVGKGTLFSPLGGYTNENWSEDYDEETFKISRREALKSFNANNRGLFKKRYSSKDKLAIVSQNYHPNDPFYTGDKSVRGHLGIRTSKTYLNESEKDASAIQSSVDQKYNSKSTQRPNRSELMSLTGAEWEAATANSPAAQSGVWEPGERWKIQKSHREWLKANNRL